MPTVNRETNILFVDDEEYILRSLQRVFKSAYSVFTAANGVQAIDIVKNNDIQVVICDQRMPGMLGVDVLKKINEISPGTMRILLTGYSDVKAIVKSVNEGEIFRYILKPWDNDSLKKTIDLAARIAHETAREYTFAALNNNHHSIKPDIDSDSPDILVVDNDEEVYQEIKKLYKANAQVFFSANIENALTLLEQKENIGIVVSDVKVNSEDITDLIVALKFHYPLIQTVITTKVSDGEIMQKLINHGQIFRVLFKPLLPDSTEKTLQGAVRKYHELLKQPALLKRYQVETSDNASVAYSRLRILSQRLAAKLKAIFGARALPDVSI
jgi:serine/threonine-protein kinase